MVAWRWMELLLLQAVLGGAAAWLWGVWAAFAAGVAVAAWLWMAWDNWQVHHLRQWLMQGELTAASPLRGIWGVLAAYVRRAVRCA